MLRVSCVFQRKSEESKETISVVNGMKNLMILIVYTENKEPVSKISRTRIKFCLQYVLISSVNKITRTLKVTTTLLTCKINDQNHVLFML